LAASLAINQPTVDMRPFSLMAAVAALRAISGVRLKWPNDVMIGEGKIGGILVERSDDELVIGLGLNLWWPSAPAGTAALYEQDPGADHHSEVGALWGAELMRLIDNPGWPIDEYRSGCQTLGRRITWEPDGSGTAFDITEDGGLVVELDGGGETTLRSGTVRHVRGATGPGLAEG
jgi:BirA family biotin operon repressor/biotin-[acetyl-CoA-carboxylase] ligase